MRHEPLQLIPGTVTEALALAAERHWPYASYRLVLVVDDLTAGGTYELVGTWAQRHDPAALRARLTELGIQPARQEQ